MVVGFHYTHMHTPTCTHCTHTHKDHVTLSPNGVVFVKPHVRKGWCLVKIVGVVSVYDLV